MSNKRLLIVTNRYPTGPDDTASPFVHDFRESLRRLGVQVEVVTPYYRSSGGDFSYLDESVFRFAWSDGNRVISRLALTNPSSYPKIWRYFQNGYRCAAQLVRANGYDGVIALWAMPSGYIARRLWRQYGIAYAVWTLGSDINVWAQRPFVGRMIRTILNDADRLFADGYELSEKVESLCEKKCTFLPSMHRIDAVKTDDTSQKENFICVGRLERSKGIFDLLEAFRSFYRRHGNWRLYYVGTGCAEAELKNAVASYQLQSAVTVCGYCDRQKTNGMLARAVAAIIPSYSDSLPLTFGEAMQASLPVICSEVGDMPRFIDKYRVGYHFPAGDIDRLAELMDDMVLESDRFRRNCPGVLAELDLSNSAQTILDWLQSTRVSGEKTEKVDAYN
ncbi:MAG: glycosyltransferase [Candidatus Zixiibacteriota bacterium]|nr:MAG: glycosyltransferase [candidate division Zixibacteria bacterium]